MEKWRGLYHGKHFSGIGSWVGTACACMAGSEKRRESSCPRKRDCAAAPAWSTRDGAWGCGANGCEAPLRIRAAASCRRPAGAREAHRDSCLAWTGQTSCPAVPARPPRAESGAMVDTARRTHGAAVAVACLRAARPCGARGVTTPANGGAVRQWPPQESSESRGAPRRRTSSTPEGGAG
jgi:hypothetical protein